MRVTGIIAEYNPFHNGHLYQLQKAKEQTNADFIIVAMSGDFMQRGTPGILNKWERAKLALLGGADLVLELPVVYATASAELFATGAVTLLESTGVINSLCFGAESDCLPLFVSLARFLEEEPTCYRDELSRLLRCGLNFPAARSGALLATFSPAAANVSTAQILDVLSNPNNILGLEYMKCLLRRSSGTHPSIVTRKGCGYHDTAVSGTLSSATAIRNALGGEAAFPDAIAHALPDFSAASLSSAQMERRFLFANDFSSILNYKLYLEKSVGFSSYLDVTPDLSNKIQNHLNAFTSFDAFATGLKSKELTLTRIYRALLHILLEIKDDFPSLDAGCDVLPYLRVLGFQKSATPLLSAIKQNGAAPLLTKTADAKNFLSREAMELLAKDLYACDLYRMVCTAKTGRVFKNEFEQSPIIL